MDWEGPGDSAPGEARHERLGGARAEFVANLGRRVAELRAALSAVEAEPGATRLREDLHRRLHALGAGARLLRFVRLAERVADAEALLEAAAAAPHPDALGSLAALGAALDELPALAWGQAALNTPPQRSAPSTPPASATWIAAATHGERALAPVPAESGAAGTAPEGAARRAGREDRGAPDVEEAVTGAPVTVLVVGPEPLADALGPGIADAGPPFEVERTDDAITAIDLARALAPDVVLLDTDLPGARALVEALSADPLTEPVPVLALGRFAMPDDAAPFVALGVARALAKPVSPDALRRAAADAAATYVRGEVVRAPLGELTLDQLGARLAEELRRGLCDAAEARGRGARVELGDGAEVLAALWGAVARIRDLVTIRSQGTVRFSPTGPEGALPLAPWIGPADGAGARWRGDARSAREEGEGTVLAAMGIVVADDDPAVTWFLAGVLRAAGATVHEAHDGARALDLAFQTSPDLVVSDVLMPRLDGFALCRALKRDVVLRDVPVILLSWKEDLLQRLRELGADADGYLRKEASAAAIVQRVREVMRGRRRVAERLAAGGEVRGRLDGLTTRTLLSLACARRPASLVSVRDAAFLYEIQIRDGRPVGATRTAPDGTFQRGPAALAALLGVGSGRFVVAPMPDAELRAPARPGFEGTLAEQLMPAVANARAAQRLLTGSSLIQVERVELDEERMAAYADATPEPARSLLRALTSGASPRALITSGQAEAGLVEDVLCDAAAHGSVSRVLDRFGEDQLAPAAARELDVLRGLRRPPGAAAPAIEVPAALRFDAAAAAPTPLEEALESAEHVAAEPTSIEAVDVILETGAIPLVPRAEAPAPAAAAAAPARVAAAAAPRAAAPAAPVVAPGPMLTLGSLTPPPVAERISPPAPVPAPAPRVADEAPADESPSPRRVRRPSAYASPVPQAAPPARDNRMTMWVLFAVAAFVFAVGARLSRERDLRPPTPAAPSALPTVTAPATTTAPVEAPAGPVGESASNPFLPEDLPLSPGDKVPEGQGLLEVVAGTNDAIYVDGRLVGTGVVKLPLEPKGGAHEIRAKLRGEERVRFAEVRPGRRTRVRLAPPWQR